MPGTSILRRPKMEATMAILMAKIDEKVNKRNREHVTLIPAPTESGRLPNEHRQPIPGTSTATSHQDRHHLRRKRTPSPEPAINSSHSDSDYTDHDNPTEPIEARIHTKAKGYHTNNVLPLSIWVGQSCGMR